MPQSRKSQISLIDTPYRYKMDIHDYLVIFSRCSRLTVTQQPWMVSYASVTKISN